MSVVPDWIRDNKRKTRQTPVRLEMSVGIAPVWDHTENRGGWYARLDTIPEMSGDPAWECDHVHLTENEAWACAQRQVDMLKDLRRTRW